MAKAILDKKTMTTPPRRATRISLSRLPIRPMRPTAKKTPVLDRPQNSVRRFLGIFGVLGLLAGLIAFLGTQAKFQLFFQKPDLPVFKDMRVAAESTQSPYEIPMCENMIVENWYDGRHCLVVEFNMYAKAISGRQEILRERMAQSGDAVRDMVRDTISSVHVADIRDPSLKVIKNGVQSRVEKIVGDDLIEKILVPDFSTYTVFQ